MLLEVKLNYQSTKVGIMSGSVLTMNSSMVRIGELVFMFIRLVVTGRSKAREAHPFLHKGHTD